jgi:hypothetical protein
MHVTIVTVGNEVFSVVGTMAVSGQRLGKHVNAATDTKATKEQEYFLCGPCREVITRAVGVMSSAKFCMGGCENRTLARDAEESPLLEAIAREQLVRTQQARKGLAGAVVICELWRFVVALCL